ncbi:MAG TPA: type II toxin-antitoxin system HicB family antitoxin [Candidatus Atribacteria bacterium]|jgi:predicted RNase H-like HicB family nuclease|nr:type II toxin-antitoxin system HicB family antitoxin [Candidatus Atribacteria bacterium]HCL89998.1 type II toxin-antitoxin system HicB family antitoxin [Candidatus Atribacteria bacterium]
MYYKVIVEPDTESGGYIAYCPTLRGCVSEGETPEEALKNIKKAIKGYLLVLEEELKRKDAKVYKVAI